jgi:hypothetical protein
MQASERAGARRASPAGAESHLVSVPRGAYIGVTIFALLLGAAGIVRGTSAVHSAADSDLTTFFFPAAQQILHGHLWAIYDVRAFGGYPNYNPPLSIYMLVPFLATANALHLNTNLGALIAFVSIPFTVFVPVLGYTTITALRRLFPAIPESQVFLAYVLIVLSPLTWQTYISWYHLEQPIMLTLLVGSIVQFQRRNAPLAGVLAGLAVLMRTTAIVPLVAFGMLLLAERRWQPVLRFGGIAAGVAAIGFAPFFLFDRANAMYSLVSWRGGSEIGGNTIWALVRYDGTRAASPLRYAIDHFARRLDMYTVLLFVAIVAFLAVRQMRVSAYGREAWAVLAIATLAVPMLTKNNWPYYYLEPFIFILIWEFASMHDRRSGLWRWPVLTFGYLSVAAMLSQFVGLQSVGFFDRAVVGLLSFIAMLAFVVAVWVRARAGKLEMAARPQSVAAQQHRVGAPAPRGAPGYAPGPPAAGAVPQGASGSWSGSLQPPVTGPMWPSAPAGPARPPEGWRPAGSQGGTPGSSAQWPSGPLAPPPQGGRPRS